MAGCDVEPETGSANGISFQNCLFTGNMGAGLMMAGAHANVTNNSVNDSVIRGNGGFGLSLASASYVSVSNSVVQGNASYGIMLGDTGQQDYPAWSNSIVGNSISGRRRCRGGS